MSRYQMGQIAGYVVAFVIVGWAVVIGSAVLYRFTLWVLGG